MKAWTKVKSWRPPRDKGHCKAPENDSSLQSKDNSYPKSIHKAYNTKWYYKDSVKIVVAEQAKMQRFAAEFLLRDHPVPSV